ncbi:hypothetical protein M9435_003588 [Picochlorum sp. BPE23]|nr:hypothetical protein M9435_003588 [Picochlorum sp. BPE23]
MTRCSVSVVDQRQGRTTLVRVVRSSTWGLQRAILCIILANFLVSGVNADDQGQGEKTCAELIQEFTPKYRAIRVSSEGTSAEGKNPFVFFLHVPRTAGKTYSSCFLSTSMKPSERCMPGYDHYRLPMSQDGCRYYVSHDDMSLLSELEGQDVVVVTQLRDPVERVLSAYEFSVEVAGRKIHESDEKIENLKANLTTVNTYNVWPWSYLIPLARRNMQERMKKLQDEYDGPVQFEEHVDPKTNRTFYFDPIKNESLWQKPKPEEVLDPYDNELVMPLRDWIETPEARELVHNGHTLQILGITNTSFWPEASRLRQCFIRDEASREALAALAKEKMEQIPHVGLQSRLDEAVASLAASLKTNMSSPVYKSIPLKAYFYDDKDAAVDLNMKVTYNSTDEGNPHKSITVLDARRLMHNYSLESSRVRSKLKKLEPKLAGLIEKEEEWFQESEKERSSSLSWKLKKQVIKPIRKRFNWMIEHAKSILFNSYIEDDDWYYDQEEQEILRTSPYDENITQLDEEVHGLQKRDFITRHDYHELKNIDVVKGVTFGPNVKAHIPFPDDEALLPNKTVGGNYATCASSALKKGKKKRRNSFTHLQTPDGKSFLFSSKSRGRIDEEILDRIKELNKADYDILEFGTTLFTKTLELQRKQDVLEEIPFPKKEENNNNTVQGTDENNNPNTNSSPRDDRDPTEL